MRVVLTVEHATNHVPVELRPLFARARRVLDSHRGWDPGALQLARALRRRLDAPLFAGTVSRLVIDLNRSLHHPALVSRWTRDVPRADLVAHYWQPFRSATREAIDAAGSVVHLSCHSFTPRLGSEVRNADIGLLYDPARPREVALVRRIHALLGDELRVRRNYPYRGTADGHTQSLRRSLPKSRYIGIEVELSQARLDAIPRVARAIARAV
ncbi:MAG: N-formylglutamate amidohydrolase [Myxococcales bacterium]|nr:N-formylglutamate amidohydrolase [Myxococcales bacterium]